MLIKKSLSRLIASLSFSGASLLLISCHAETPPLKQLNLERNAITVSGLSSGGYMAHQYHLAYSEQVSGAAMLASGPYGCAQGSLEIALADCVSNKNSPDITPLLKTARDAEKAQLIAPLKNLLADKVWVFHGLQDATVSRGVVDSLVSFYQALGATVTLNAAINSGHGMPSDQFGVQCDVTGSPFINHCELDAAGTLLNYFYPELKKKTTVKGEIVSFDQSRYLNEGEENTLADTGFLYVPKDCAEGVSCRLHVAFHGCSQNEQAVGLDFVTHAGYNVWAEANNIVVLYPQTKSSYVPLNPKACWDWWGYTGDNYLYRNAAQLQHINNMVNAI